MDPLDKRKQTDKIVDQVAPCRSAVVHPFLDGRLGFDIAVGAGNRESGFPSCDRIRILVLKLYSEDFGQAVADLGSCVGHEAGG
jgi:hypothetical protein